MKHEQQFHTTLFPLFLCHPSSFALPSFLWLPFPSGVSFVSSNHIQKVGNAAPHNVFPYVSMHSKKIQTVLLTCGTGQCRDAAVVAQQYRGWGGHVQAAEEHTHGISMYLTVCRYGLWRGPLWEKPLPVANGSLTEEGLSCPWQRCCAEDCLSANSPGWGHDGAGSSSAGRCMSCSPCLFVSLSLSVSLCMYCIILYQSVSLVCLNHP